MDNQMELEFAQWMAEQAVERLRDACERIEVAGSVRRKKPNPSDIEIVCTPRYQAPEIQGDMFGAGYMSAVVKVNLLDMRCDYLLAYDGALEKRLDKNGRSAWGSGLKRAIFFTRDNDGRLHLAPLDLFPVVGDSSWGVIYAIRTGPGDFNHLLVTDRSIGGGCPTDRKVAGGRVWDLAELPLERQLYASGLKSTQFLGFTKAAGLKSLETPEEEDFFEQLQVPCWPPEQRTVEHLQQYLKNGK